MNVNIYNYTLYRDYLKAELGDKKVRRGVKSRLARAIPCQLSYLSQVLKKSSHFSLEQGLRIATFLELSSLETQYLLLLIQYERAGSYDLQKHFKSLILEERKKNSEIHRRINARNTIKPEIRQRYYSSWEYAAIHIASSLESLSNRKDISKALSIPLKKVDEVLSFLIDNNFVQKDELEGLSHQLADIHLPGDSPMVAQLHRNWRLKSFTDSSTSNEQRTHFSFTMAIDEECFLKIQQRILKVIEDSTKDISDAPSKEVYQWNIDLYSLME